MKQMLIITLDLIRNKRFFVKCLKVIQWQKSYMNPQKVFSSFINPFTTLAFFHISLAISNLYKQILHGRNNGGKKKQYIDKIEDPALKYLI